MLSLTYAAEVFGELTLTSMLGQIWILPFLIYLNVADTANTSRWVIWTVTTLLLSYPNGRDLRGGNCQLRYADTVASPCYTGRLELKKLEYGPISNRLSSLL